MCDPFPVPIFFVFLFLIGSEHPTRSSSTEGTQGPSRTAPLRGIQRHFFPTDTFFPSLHPRRRARRLRRIYRWRANVDQIVRFQFLCRWFCGRFPIRFIVSDQRGGPGYKFEKSGNRNHLRRPPTRIARCDGLSRSVCRFLACFARHALFSRVSQRLKRRWSERKCYSR